MKGIKWHYILLLGLSIFVAISVLVLWPEPSARQTLPTPSELVIHWDEAKDYAGQITATTVDYHSLCTAVTPAC